ncbi:MAG: S1 RNA-binding domain-containing protein, partial [Gemmatimonadota bacterium]|nr:S1 RNA-binding domain-containing protein [Gemmatimonadota bacterium]
ETYQGTVKSVTAFGAFIEIMPGTEALLHVSEMRHTRVEKPEDVVKKGEQVTVKLIDRDERGRLRLSMKALLPKPEGAPAASNGEAEGEPAGEPVAAGGGERSRGDRPRGGGRGGRGGRSRE